MSVKMHHLVSHFCHTFSYTVVPKSDVPENDIFLKFCLYEYIQVVPKSDTVFGIWLSSECVTF